MNETFTLVLQYTEECSMCVYKKTINLFVGTLFVYSVRNKFNPNITLAQIKEMLVALLHLPKVPLEVIIEISSSAVHVN